MWIAVPVADQPKECAKCLNTFPLQGWAVYYNAGRDRRNVAWEYENPTAAFAAIKGYLAFYPSKVVADPSIMSTQSPTHLPGHKVI